VLLAAVIAFEAFGVGLGTTAFVAYIARATDPRYTATQFALFTSLAAVPRTVVNASTGWVVEQTGWFNFYLCGLNITQSDGHGGRTTLGTSFVNSAPRCKL